MRRRQVGPAEQLRHHLRELRHGDPLTTADVDHLAPEIGGVARGQEIRVHRVGDIREVARLVAGTVNHRRSVVRQRFRERGNHTGVGAVGVLARTEDVEVAQRDGVDLEAGCIGAP